MTSAGYPECVRLLIDNPKEDFVEAANLLIWTARNIMENPTVEKYKSIEICGEAFKESLLPVKGAVQCLSEMGFVKLNEKYVYMAEPGAAQLRNMRMSLEKAVNGMHNVEAEKLSENVQNNPIQQNTAAFLNIGGSQCMLIVISQIPVSPEHMMQHRLESSEHEIQRQLEFYFNRFLMYGNDLLQEKARSVIPLDVLKKKAQDRLNKKPEFSNPQGKTPLSIADCLIIELLHWYKYKFFKWIDSPKCAKCPDAKRTPKGTAQPTQEEKMWDAGCVEIYTCDNCGGKLQYPRYNNPEKLLETRGGKCGEWANCFTLLCVALGYETRHIIDWTDHVWTEVYSTAAKRWIHLDPCENTFDKPLMYQKLWSKELSLIIGVSLYEIADVTWRYIENIHDANVESRRSKLFREDWLQGTLSNMSEQRQFGISGLKENEINDRRLREAVELSSPKVKSSVVYTGRTTRSTEWQRARGGLGENIEQESVTQQLAKEKEGTLHVKYFSAEDKYVLNPATDDMKGWKTLVHSFKSVERKIEEDCRMAYLARTPSSESGNVCWKFDLSESGKNTVVKSVAIKVQSTTFQSGEISWLFCSDKSSQQIESGKRYQFQDEVRGSKVVSLSAFLKGGHGENAWQHTQLFRECLDNPSAEPQLDIAIKYYTEQNQE